MAKHSNRERRTGGARLLVVEDSLTLNRLVTHLLRESGYEVHSCADGAEAIELTLTAMREGRGFDVILMDVILPELNGCDATYQLRQQGFAGKILMLTAADEDYDLPRAFSAGADDYLAKPFTPGDLRHAIERNLADGDVNPLTRNPSAA
jgi:CheY-like chemotaxis protein